jgi:large conductance mechanosensitive channel
MRDIAGFDHAKKAFTLFDEFKSFALKGNVIDLAVAVIIGTAFGKIVSSLVADIFMPLVTAIAPGQSAYSTWAVIIGGQTVNFGNFLAEVINFLVVALALFIFVSKFLGWVLRARKQEAAAPPPPPVPTREEVLLTEIRDLLRQRAG